MWVDLEMTGLSPEKDRILEVAAIATDWDFNELETYTAVVKVDEALMKERMVGEFWEQNEESYKALVAQNADGKPAEVVEKELMHFVDRNFDDVVYLAGNSFSEVVSEGWESTVPFLLMSFTKTIFLFRIAIYIHTNNVITMTITPIFINILSIFYKSQILSLKLFITPIIG